MTGTRLGRRLSLAACVTLVAGLAAVPVQAAKTYQLKACITTKTGAVRVVTKSVKCKSSEKYQDLNTTVAPANSVLSGPVPPVDNRTGKDGDFYVDILKKQFYGPRVAGMWGPPFNIIGAQGPKGEPGPAGPTGSTGASGSPGPAGPAGAAGPAGPAGAAGTNGRTILSGSGAPASGTGANGDFYIDTVTSTLYGPKASNAWPAGISLVGPSGGRTILNGTVAPDSATVGSTGDFYIDTIANLIYGPKSASGWGSGTSIVGPTGATGPKGETGTVGTPGPIGPQGPKGETGTIAALSYGSFYDTSTVTLETTSAVAVPYNTTLFTSGISITNDTATLPAPTRIVMANRGVYDIQFSIQVANPLNSALTVSLWLRKNGVDVPWTNTALYVGSASSDERKILSWNFFVQAEANDYFQIVVSSTKSGIQLLSVPPANDPTGVGIPSTILTVNQVADLPAG